MRNIFLIALLFQSIFANSSNILQFSHYTVDDGLPQNTVHSIVQDKYGFMWFGTWHGLSKFDGKTFKNYYHSTEDSTSIINNRVHLLYKDVEGDIWVSTFDTIVCKYNYETDNFTRYNPSQLPVNIQDSTNRHNTSYYRDVYYKNRKWSVSNNSLIQTDTQTNEVYKYVSSVFNNFSLNNDVVYSVFVDKTFTLWVGTGMGVSYVNLLSDNIFYKPYVVKNDDTFTNSAVRAIFVDENYIWLASNNHGISQINKLRNEEFAIPFRPNEFRSNIPRTIYKDSKGLFWFGFRMGLASFNPKTNHIYNYKNDEFPQYPVYVVKEDANDELWIGGYNYLLKLNRKSNSFETYNLPYDNLRTSIMDFYFDNNDNIWVCTELSGLIKVDREKDTKEWRNFIVYSNSQDSGRYIPDNRVYSICQDKESNLWIATGDGLCKINSNTDKIEIFNKNKGLLDSYISKVYAVDDYVWFSHKQGLSRINIYSNEVENFYVKSGLGNYEFVDGSGYFDKNTNTLYFGGLDGYVVVNPHNSENLGYLPDVVLTDFYVKNKKINVGEKYSANYILERPIYMTNKISLAYEDNSFSIDFSAMHYSNLIANKFIFKLEGYEKEFIEVGYKKQSVSYAGLKPGEYKLIVNSVNNQGLEGANPASLTVVIKPPWWISWWAYSIYMLFLLLIFSTIYYILKIKLNFKHKLDIERVEKEKIKELQNFRTNFFTSISHELRNPVTLIIDPVERMVNGLVKGADNDRYLSLIHNNAQRLLNILNQFLAFKKIEEGSEKIENSVVNIDKFFHHIYSMFEIKALNKDINYNIQVKNKEKSITIDIDKVEKIIYNLLENAFKYTPEKGNVEMRIELINEDKLFVKIEIVDSGVGISENEKDKIFDFFYRSENLKSSFESYGVGLPYVKELVLLMGGEIYVESVLNQGSNFTVKIPVEESNQLSSVDDNVLCNIGIAENEDTKSSTLLVVEDNPEIREYLTEILSSTYNIITATNGQEGFESALKNNPDLIITDVFMPIVSGVQFCEMVKNDMRTCFIPVVMLTSLNSVESQLQGLEVGADVYLTKPFNSSVLFAQIKSLLKKQDNLKNITLSDAKVESETDFIIELKQIIKENINSNLFDVETLAEKLNLSRSQLYRKVKNESEQTVSQIITSIRMDYAKELLMSGKKNVSEVSYSIGYSEPNNFSRAFQNYFGVSPKDFMP